MDALIGPPSAESQQQLAIAMLIGGLDAAHAENYTTAMRMIGAQSGGSDGSDESDE